MFNKNKTDRHLMVNIVLVMLTLITVFSSIASAQLAADSISVASATGENGQTIQVPVNITNVVNGPLQVIMFDVSYDHSAIDILGVTTGDALPDTAFSEWSVSFGSNHESITLSTSDQSIALPNGSTGTIAVLWVNVTGMAGQLTDMNLIDVDVSSTDLKHGTIPTINGTFTVTGEVATTGDVVINEFVSDSATEWVELYNKGTTPVNITDWTLKDGALPAKPLSGIIQIGGYMVFSYSSWLNNGGDIIYLNSSTANVDRVTYGNWDDGNTVDNAPKPGAGESAGRYPNGVDTDTDSVDFILFDSPTPGAENVVTDTTPPVITSVGNNTPTTDSVTIIWTTDEDSDSLVKYGITSGTYAANKPDTAMVTSHSIALTGLSANTTYYFVVNSTDASNNSGQSSEHSFRTAATTDTTPPDITSVGNTMPTTDSVTITWTTDESSDSLVKYGITSGTYANDESSAAMVTSHSITLTGLSANTTYYFVVNSTDASDNSDESSEHSFRTAATTPDTTAPTVTANTPTGTNVPVSTAISVTFSEVMNHASAEGAFSINPDVGGSFRWVDNTMIFDLNTSLAYDTTYAVTIGAGATDLAGNPLEDAFNWGFTTASEEVSEGDTTAPTIIANVPTGTGVSVSRVISVVFDEAMNHAAAEGAFSINPDVDGSFSWVGTTMIFDPDTNLAYGTTYEVTIGTGATDLAGNPLEDAFNWGFTTASGGGSGGDTTAPSIIANAPTGAGVSVSTVISVAFDEAMNHASAEGAFSIDPDVDGSFSWVGTTMIFDPDTNLAYGTTYEVTIGTGAMDLAGNPLEGAFIWDFTTESAPAPTIASGDPASPVSDIAGATRRFSIMVDQTVNVTWLINDTQVQLNVSVTEASYTDTNAVPGRWNVSAVAENENGTDMQTWIWNVAETTGVSITGKTNFTAASGDVNVTGNFSNSLSGWINVTDTGDDPAASPDVNTSTLRAGLGDPDVFVSGVYIDVSLSNIEDEMTAGNGSMRIELHYTDAKLAALGITDENTPDIYKFNETTDMWELVRTQSYCIDSGRNTTANYVYVEVTELCTFALVGKSSAPTLVTYTITNTPQTTSIDVEFSEPVSAIIKIEDASGNLVNELYTSSGVTDPDPQIWDGTYTNGTTVPDGTYTVNVSGVSTTTGLSVVNTSKTVDVLAAGAVSITLYEGWNLIAVPVNDPTADTAAELASKIDGCKEVVMWDATEAKYVPYTNVGTWTGTNFAITGDMGIFVNVEGATTVDFTGGAWS